MLVFTGIPGVAVTSNPEGVPMTRKLLAVAVFAVACTFTLYAASDAGAVDEAPAPRAVEGGDKKPDAKGKFGGFGQGKFGGKFDPEKMKGFKGKFDPEKFKGKFDPEKFKGKFGGFDKGKFGKGFPGKGGKKKEDDKEE